MVNHFRTTVCVSVALLPIPPSAFPVPHHQASHSRITKLSRICSCGCEFYWCQCIYLSMFRELLVSRMWYVEKSWNTKNAVRYKLKYVHWISQIELQRQRCTGICHIKVSLRFNMNKYISLLSIGQLHKQKMYNKPYKLF